MGFGGAIEVVNALQHSEEFTEAKVSDHCHKCCCGWSSQSLYPYIKMIYQQGRMLSWWWVSYEKWKTAKSLILKPWRLCRCKCLCVRMPTSSFFKGEGSTFLFSVALVKTYQIRREHSVSFYVSLVLSHTLPCMGHLDQHKWALLGWGISVIKLAMPCISLRVWFAVKTFLS